MVTVPSFTPVTCPVVASTVAMVATVVFSEYQLPPGELVRIMFCPTPTAVGPVIGSGDGFTVISVPVREQPFGRV